MHLWLILRIFISALPRFNITLLNNFLRNVFAISLYVDAFINIFYNKINAFKLISFYLLYHKDKYLFNKQT